MAEFACALVGSVEQRWFIGVRFLGGGLRISAPLSLGCREEWCPALKSYGAGVMCSECIWPSRPLM
jgi:hypothetical protein